MNTRRFVNVLVFVLAALALTALVAGAQGEPAPAGPLPSVSVSPPWWNLVQNPSFESGSGNPAHWTHFSWAGSGNFQWVSNQFVDGAKSVKIVNNAPDDSRWQQTVTVLPNTDYALSGWIKTQNVGHTTQTIDAGANLSIESNIPGTGFYTYTPPLFGTNDWTYVSVVFNSGSNNHVIVDARLGMYNGITTGTAWFDDVQLAQVRKLYLSSNQSGTVGGVNFAPGDILVHNPALNTWAMYFDASDVGITKNLDDFAIGFTAEHQPWIVLSLQAKQNVPGRGLMKPQDFVVFYPTSLGPNTAGGWGAINYGATHGRAASSEAIDALINMNTGVLMSTTGAATVPYRYNPALNITARDEDLFLYDDTVGMYDTAFVGANVPGLAVEDVFAAEKFGGVYYLTILGNGLIDGHNYNQKDIFAVDGSNHLLGRFWNGPAHGFNYNIDAIAITD